MSQGPLPPWGTPPGAHGGGAPPFPVLSARPAEPGERALARLLDLLVLGVAGAVLNLVLGILLLPLSLAAGTGDADVWSVVALVRGVLDTGAWLAVVLCYCLLEAGRTGQTLGKMVLRLHVETLGGSPASRRAALLRNVWLLALGLAVVPLLGPLVLVPLALLALGTGLGVSIARSPERRSWADRLAGTRVVRRG